MSSTASPLNAASQAPRASSRVRALPRLRFDRAAFLRVFNLRSVALAFWIVFLMVVSSTVAWTWGSGVEAWFFTTGYMTRQWLVSAGCVLLFTALAEAMLPPTLERPARQTWIICFIVAGAFAAANLRILLGRAVLMEMMLAWYVGTVLLWSVLGVLAHRLFAELRDEELARERLADAQCEQERLAAQATEAQLSALQAQIEPHFLFNSLATVKRLYETDPSRGREMMASLIGYFRAVLPSMRGATPGGSTLGSELELARSYLTILKLRMGERLEFTVECDDGLADATLPPMLLPTLVENAIKHGLTPLLAGGRIDVRAFVRDGALSVQVADTGAGFVAAGGSGVGLANTRQRLQALYGSAGSLELRANQPRGVVAEIRVPLTSAPQVVH